MIITNTYTLTITYKLNDLNISFHVVVVVYCTSVLRFQQSGTGQETILLRRLVIREDSHLTALTVAAFYSVSENYNIVLRSHYPASMQ